MGSALAEYAGAKPYRGILTGLNDAFLIDMPTKETIIRSDQNSESLIRPYLARPGYPSMVARMGRSLDDRPEVER